MYSQNAIKEIPEVREYLSKNHWPVGLQDTLLRGLNKYKIRYIIADDSGSMMASDGAHLVGEGNDQQMIACSRWTELVTSMTFHAKLAEVAQAKTEFRLLNQPQPIVLGLGPENDSVNYTKLIQLFQSGPRGGTPLCRHIREVIQEIEPQAAELRANNQKAVIVIATDGRSSDGDVLTAMKPLERLPVWVVIRLCTDEPEIAKYWSEIDKNLELEVDVLDDLTAEAEEVNEQNPWLVYGVPMQRLREFGISSKEIDLLDERTLSSEQARTCLSILLGGNLDDYPHPEVDWYKFKSFLEKKLQECDLQWSPTKKRMKPWVSVKRFGKTYGKASKCTIM